MCPKYAAYDPALDPAPVNGWYDTDAFTYGSLPDFRTLFTVTDVQWETRAVNPTNWAISGGVLIAYTAPVPLPQQAQVLLAQKLALGVTVTSASLPAINATYALDSASIAQIFQIGSFANSFGVFPSGDSLQIYPDIDSAPHVFTVSVFIAFLRAVAALVSNLQVQTSIMAQGGAPTWPTQAAILA